jgi:fructokinase
VQTAPPKITCWGELVWDIFPDTSQTLNGSRVLGGSATALAAQLAALGAEVTLVSAVGSDDDGTLALRELTRRGVNVSYVRRSSGATAAVEIRVRACGEPEYTANRRLNWAELRFEPDLASALAEADALTFSLFAQGTCLDLRDLERVLQRKRPRWVGCDLNLRREVSIEVLGRVAQSVDLVKLNQKEYELAARPLGGEDPSAWLLRSGRTSVVALTLGEQGARLITRDAVIAQAGRTPPCPVDTVGAGDAFMAGLSLSLIAGLPAQDALLRAMAGAELQLMLRGAMPEGRDS